MPSLVLYNRINLASNQTASYQKNIAGFPKPNYGLQQFCYDHWSVTNTSEYTSLTVNLSHPVHFPDHRLILPTLGTQS